MVLDSFRLKKKAAKTKKRSTAMTLTLITEYSDCGALGEDGQRPVDHWLLCLKDVKDNFFLKQNFN